MAEDPKDSPERKKIEAVMRVQLGQATVAEVCRDLDLSRRYYYIMEEQLMGALLGAAQPKKRGPKPKQEDPQIAEMNAKLRAAERERQLLELKVKNLEEVNEAIRTRVLSAAEGKKKGKRRPQRARRRKPLSGELPESDLGGRTTPGPGRQERERSLPASGDSSEHLLRLESERRAGTGNAGGERTAPGDPARDGG